MARIVLTPHLARHIACPELSVEAETLGGALAAAFERCPGLRGYVLDDQGDVRRHVALFVDGQRAHGPDPLARAIDAASEIYVMQALSGG